MLTHVKMQVESVRENAVAQAKLHAEAEKKEVGAHNSDSFLRVKRVLYKICKLHKRLFFS